MRTCIAELGERRAQRGHVGEREGAHHEVDRGVVDGQGAQVTEAKVALGHLGLGPGQHRAVGVDADDLEPRCFGVGPTDLAPMPETDWVAHVAGESVPTEAGRFFVHGSHFVGGAPPGRVPVLIDATRAFGSGTHESTRGCLIALDRLLTDRPPGRVLDLGAGSGILAIALAKAGVAGILAADNDSDAVAIARENVALNGVGGQVRCLRSQGFRNRALRVAAPFDWIVANILAEPLIRLAPPIMRYLRPGGTAVLAGFLVEQGGRVEAAYRRQGGAVADRIDLAGWRTLVVARS